MNINQNYITADDLFKRVADILNLSDITLANRMMHETLVLCCREALRSSKNAFGNLFSQVDYLCKLHHVRTADAVAIQKMRRDSNRSRTMTPEDILYNCRALALFIAAVFDTSVPSLLTGRIPTENKPKTTTHHIDYRYIRCVVDEFDQQQIRATADQDGENERALIIDYSEQHLQHLRSILRKNMQLNLLNCEQVTNDDETILKPNLIVVEPDYLIDISSIAACFQSYGHHPLSYTIRRMSPNANSQPLLLGNFAGRVLDDVINCEGTYDWQRTFRAHFRQQALDYCTCPDLNQKEDYKTAAKNQADNIQQIVADLFPQTTAETPNDNRAKQAYTRENAILEPSFLCEHLGLQGRVDLMTTDFHLLVEQKSGKNSNIERKYPNKYGSFQKEDHYVQLLLYYGVLMHNFNLSTNNINARLLYSKYPLPGGLVVVSFYQKLFQEAIALRNQIVGTDFYIARQGFEPILKVLKPETLLERKNEQSYFEKYIKPEKETVTGPFHRLSPLEKAYVCRMMTFAYREQLASRLGNSQKPGNSAADIWNIPLAEKKELGVIYTDLTISKKDKTDADHGFDIITLSVPNQGENFLPNFRTGDSVYLYAYKEGEEPDARRALLFKATLTEILSDQLVVVLNDGQSNPNLLVPADESATKGENSTARMPHTAKMQHSEEVRYAIEHCDIGGSSPMKALAAFAAAAPTCRNLLLGIQPSRTDTTLQLTKYYNPYYDDIVLRAKQAQDYFLLVGPPGTGKTSLALRFLVEETLYSAPQESSQANGQQKPPTPSVLLTAYTNRAVDEICDMLSSAGLDYLRLGKEYACDVRFRSHMLREMLGEQPNLNNLRQRLSEVSIVVGTTSTLQSQSSLFSLKHFSLAIVDEASQILEPQIIGLLCQVPKFILIGDHKQLPAVVQQSEEESAVHDEQLKAIGLTNCRNSLFERLLKNCPESCMGILRRQGRMHPDIAEWPNRMFYHREQLQPVPLPHQTEPTTEPRLLFIGSKCQEGMYSDKVNPDEARIVAQELKKVFVQYGDRFDPDKTVGVIVPYRNQISMIRREIELLNIPQLLDISIDTVERYQGSQRDVIIYSTTITRRYQLDFLCANTFEEDGYIIDRKLNVALTRARCRMIITGHESTLRQNPLYASLIDYIKTK
ncbi:MAG: DNA2/NAM7 family helicase [Prevotella sp.]|nr:DNA2/NAM7 family helicase [Prevotella sp.]